MKFGKYESSDRSNLGTAVTFLMIGLGAGALVALLLAPKSGKQLRRDLRRKYDDARDTLQDWSDDASDKVQDAVERSTEWAEELREAARQKAAPITRCRVGTDDLVRAAAASSAAA
jgi:gas vesicle protein